MSAVELNESTAEKGGESKAVVESQTDWVFQVARGVAFFFTAIQAVTTTGSGVLGIFAGEFFVNTFSTAAYDESWDAIIALATMGLASLGLLAATSIYGMATRQNIGFVACAIIHLYPAAYGILAILRWGSLRTLLGDTPRGLLGLFGAVIALWRNISNPPVKKL